MKKHIILIASIFSLLISCDDRDIDIITSYPFEVESRNNETATINVGEQTVFEIAPEKELTMEINPFEFKYNIKTGEGYFIDNGVEIEENEFYPLESLVFDFDFVGTELGDALVEIEIKDSERSQVLELNYNVEESAFLMSLNAINTFAVIQETKNFTLVFDDLGQEGVIYDLELSISQGTGDIYLLNDDGEILREVNQNETFEIVSGTYNFSVAFEESGTNILNASITDSNTTKRSETLEYEVLDSSFTFTATRTLAEAAIGEGIDINYIISEENQATQDSYTMIYSSTKNGYIVINGQQYQPGAIIPLTELEFTATYFGTSLEDHIISSTIKSESNNVEVEEETEVFFTTSEFTFDVTTDIELTVGDTIDIGFLIQETTGESDLNISYSVSGPNQILKNSDGIELNSGTEYDVQSNTFEWSLTAIEQGSVTITYTAFNQYGFKIPVEITYDILPITFDFSVSATSTEFVIGKDSFYQFIMDSSSSIDYELSFTNNGGGAMVVNGGVYNAGEKAPLENNEDFDIVFQSYESGQNIINFTITGSNGIEVTKTLNINYKEDIQLERLKASYERVTCRDIRTGCEGFSEDYIEFTVTKDNTFTIERVLVEVDRSEVYEFFNFTIIDTDTYVINDMPNIFSIDSRVEVTVFDSGGNSVRWGTTLEIVRNTIFDKYSEYIIE